MHENFFKNGKNVIFSGSLPVGCKEHFEANKTRISKVGLLSFFSSFIGVVCQPSRLSLCQSSLPICDNQFHPNLTVFERFPPFMPVQIPSAVPVLTLTTLAVVFSSSISNAISLTSMMYTPFGAYLSCYSQPKGLHTTIFFLFFFF
jgi:hypothetical protein